MLDKSPVTESVDSSTPLPSTLDPFEILSFEWHVSDKGPKRNPQTTTLVPVLEITTKQTVTTLAPALEITTEQTVTTLAPALEITTKQTVTTLAPALEMTTKQTVTTLKPILEKPTIISSILTLLCNAFKFCLFLEAR